MKALLDLKPVLPDLRQRLLAIEPYWSEVAYEANLSYGTIEGIVRQRPGRCNPRYDTLCMLADALQIVEARHDIPSQS